MLLSFISLAIHLFYAYGLDIITNNGNLHLVNKNIAPDGFTRPAVLAGTSSGSANFPGPLIQGKKGDKFNLNVIDSLTDSSMNRTTSIHWHGLFQAHTNWADGPSMVTQCPIAPGHSFLYSFSAPDQAGTYWYHSHLGVQYCDGLRGPFVIRDPHDPHAHLYDIDDENTIITLADWYHTKARQIRGGAVSDATLINGLGRSVGGNSSLTVVNVQPGKRYRFRIISMSCDPSYVFGIDGHNLTVIEADGVNTIPVTVNQIPIFAAQRYSVVLEANQPVGNYWIRANVSVALTGSAPSTAFANGINSAILRYRGAPNTDPTTSQPLDVVALNEHMLVPLSNPGAPRNSTGQADMVFDLTLGFNAPNFTINGTSFVDPDIPVLLQILSGAQNAQDLLPKGSVIGLPKNKVIQINLHGGTAPGGPHPFHLHGHTFDVVKSYDSLVVNWDTPVRRDVTPVTAGNTTSIVFTTDNPGPWFLHCHIDFHLAAGLAVVMAEDIKDVNLLTDPVTPQWATLCPIYHSLGPDEL